MDFTSASSTAMARWSWTDAKRLAKQARQIEDLRNELESLWPPHELTRSEKVRVIAAVKSIVDHTRPDETPQPRLVSKGDLWDYGTEAGNPENAKKVDFIAVEVPSPLLREG